jgi:NADH:ubiquinone oxidoreductase subunit F (NADH-binding)
VTATTLGAPRLLAGPPRPGRDASLAAHLATHGPLPHADPARLLALLDAAPIAGRGGAGFPLAAKLRALAAGAREVVVNAAESDPTSRKDRELLRRAPHLVLDGAVLAADALGARRITVATHATSESLGRAIAERPDRIRIATGQVPPRLVAGEGRALLRAVRGGPALPPGRREHATAQGVLLGNAETFAQLAVLVRLGAQRFAATGTRGEPGTTLLTVSGAVARPGVLEIPLGTPLGIVLSAAGAADPQLVAVGGCHGSWLRPDPDVRLCHSGLAAVGGTFGPGAVIVLGNDTCALGELARAAAWLAAESSRRCGPCRFGLPALAEDVRLLCLGDPAAPARLVRRLPAVRGRGACAHPDGAVRFVASGLNLLADEIARHARGGCGRPVLGQLAVGS